MKQEIIAIPPFVDLHVHYREPSPVNTVETFANGTLAAAQSGILLSADMPNTPGHETWTLERVTEKAKCINETANGLVMVHAGGQPESDNIAEFALMAPDTACLKLYGGKTTNNQREYQAEDFRENVAEWHRVAPDSPIIFHAGKDNLEDMINLVAGTYGHHIHIAHVNHPNQVNLIKKYKDRGFKVTCGVTPHHLLMDSHMRVTRGKFAEVMPSLAEQDDAEKLMHLLAIGDIDMIETDYAPHAYAAKMQAEEQQADCFGEPGIEHVAPQLFYQVEKGRLSMERLIDAFSRQPAELLGVKLDKRLQVIWRMHLYMIGETDTCSGAGWSPYIGNLAIGEVVQMPAIAQRDNFVRREEYIYAA